MPRDLLYGKDVAKLVYSNWLIQRHLFGSNRVTDQSLSQSLLEWQGFNDERLSFQRKVEALDKRCKQLKATIQEKLEASGEHSLTCDGFTVAWDQGKGYVAWQDEYLKVAGPKAVADLIDQAAKNASRVLTIISPVKA